MPGATSPTRQFLMKRPRPMKVRLHIEGEKEPRIIALQPGQSWAKLADSLDALNPTIIEAVAGDDSLIRATNEEQLAEAAAEGDEPDDGSDELPSVDLDPDRAYRPTPPRKGEREIETFARLLADAHRSSAQRAFDFVETAFAHQVQLLNAQTRRLDQLERVATLQQQAMLRQGVDPTGDGTAAGGTGGLLEQMISQMMTNYMVAQASKTPTPTNGTTNGAAHHPPANGGAKV